MSVCHERTARTVLLAGIVVITGLSVDAAEPLPKLGPPEDVVFTSKHDGTEQRYVLMKPDGFRDSAEQPCSVLVALHGHGSDRWQFVNDQRPECSAARDSAARMRMLYMSPDYRAKTSWMGPAATADLRQILLELRKQYHIEKVIVSGGSMGGTSAVAFAAMHPELVDGVVSMNGTANMLEYDQFSDAITAAYGGTKAEKPEIYRQRSAEFSPHRLTMPTAFTTGGQDKLVPPDSTLRLVKLLQQRRLPVESIHRPDGGHDTNYEDAMNAYRWVLEKSLHSGDFPPPSMIDFVRQPVKIVCLGDSVTGIYYHTGGRRAYPEFLEIGLERAFPEATVQVINAGISGHSTDLGLARLDKDVLSHQPDIVTISFGLNDMTRLTSEQFRANLEQLIDRCQERKADVVLCTPNAVINTAGRPIEKLKVFCDVIRAVGRDRQLRVCDQYLCGERHQQRDQRSWRLTLSDEIHPNADGHRRMAEELCRTIAGKHVALDDLAPPLPALPKLRKLLAAKQLIRVLAMQPLDSHAAVAIQSLNPNSRVEVTPWPVFGKSLAEIEQEANKFVRAMKPDVVLLTIPRDAAAPNDEQFIRSVSWIMNWSLSFGLQEWDVVVVHSAVIDPSTQGPRDDLVRQLVQAQDLDLIDRKPNEERSLAELLAEWLRSHSRD